MKLVRYTLDGKNFPGIIDFQGGIRSLASVIDDICGDTLSEHYIEKLITTDINTLPKVPLTAKLLPCVANVSKFVCIGLNYVDHAKEAGRPIPDEPVIFMKATSSISLSRGTNA